MPNGRRIPRDDDERDDYWQRGRFGVHWEDRSSRWDRDEPYRDDDRHDRSSYDGGGGYLGQGGQQMGYERSYEPHGTHRYGERGYMGFPSHRGKGPVGYTRSDERIRELVCDALTDDHYVDATHIEVTVRNGEVTLAGTVDDRVQKRMAEACVESVGGVKDVHNQLRIRV